MFEPVSGNDAKLVCTKCQDYTKGTNLIRYYFNIRDGWNVIPDDEGMEDNAVNIWGRVKVPRQPQLA